MIFATSCENELEVGAAGEEAMVSFTIATPDMGSRAYSDGQSATQLQYAVYNSNGELLQDLTSAKRGIVTMQDRGATVKLPLVTGNSYKVIFWADAEDAPYTVTFANDIDDAKMEVSYGGVSNDEARDAFYKYHTFTVSGAQTETIELKRPFAQLNIGTKDYAEAKKAGYEPTQSAVTVKNVYNTLNLASGAVENEVEANFALADIKKEETFPVAGYEYLAMNYLLVDSIKELVEVTFSYKEEGGAEQTRTVGSVPVQRNYRTNIYGELLTSDVDINVEIKPEYKEPAHEAEALFLAAATGGEVTLTEDVVLNAPLKVQANMVINLGDNKLTGSINVADGVELTVNNGTIENTNKEYSGIESTGKLTLNNVEITSARHAVRIEGGEAVINGGIYKVAPAAGKSMTIHALNVSGNSKVTIKGGTFVGPKGTNADSGAAVNVQSGATVTIEGGDFSGGKTKTLSVSGTGTLIVKGGSFDQNPANYIAESYRAAKVGNKWVVVAEDSYAVGEVVAVEGVKSIVFSVNPESRTASAVKAVSIEEKNLKGLYWQDAMNWAAGLGEGWELASMEDLNAIYNIRCELNDVLEAENAENTLFWEGDELYTKNGSVYYALYMSRDEAPAGECDANGNKYWENRVFFKIFNKLGYSDVLYSAFDCINKYAPLRDNYFARAVKSI